MRGKENDLIMRRIGDEMTVGCITVMLVMPDGGVELDRLRRLSDSDDTDSMGSEAKG
jgi:hypothetical protein